MGIKQFLKDITGITANEIQARIEEAKKADEARILKEEADKLEEQSRLKKAEEARIRKERRAKAAEAKLTPKERATKKGEPWVDVIDFKINEDNIRNGFFELDWNDHFIVQLRNEGYGLEGDPEEEIVERWYRDICAHVAAEEDIPMNNRTAGSLNLNIRKLPDNKSEIG